MNKELLKYYIRKNGDVQSDLAEYMGVSYVTLNKKINSRGSEFTQGEIASIKERYNLNMDELAAIFFDANVSKKDTRRTHERN